MTTQTQQQARTFTVLENGAPKEYYLPDWWPLDAPPPVKNLLDPVGNIIGQQFDPQAYNLIYDNYLQTQKYGYAQQQDEIKAAEQAKQQTEANTLNREQYLSSTSLAEAQQEYARSRDNADRQYQYDHDRQQYDLAMYQAKQQYELTTRSLNLQQQGQEFNQGLATREQGYDPATGRTFGQSLSLRQQDFAEKPKSIDQMVVDALYSKNFDYAFALDEFQKQPTSADRLNAALAFAKSPGDLLTLTMMQRGELPAQARQGEYGRVVDNAPYLQQAATDFFKPFDRSRLQSGAPQPTAVQPITRNGQPRVIDGTARPITENGQPPVSDGEVIPRQPVPTGAQIPIPAAVASGQDSEAQGTYMPSANYGAAVGAPVVSNQFDINGYNPDLSNEDYFRKLRQATAGQPVGPVDSSYARGGIAGLNGPEVALLGENGPEQVTPMSPDYFSRAPQVQGSSLPYAVRQAGLQGGPISRPRSLPALGALTFRSRQAQANMTPTEGQFFQRAVEQQGVPLYDYLQAEQQATAIGGPRRRQAQYIPRYAGYR